MSAIAVAALLLLGPAPEDVAIAPLALEWHAPAGCPERETIDDRLHALLPELGELGLVGVPARVSVSGRIDLADGDRWEVNLRFESERGVDERRFFGPDCVALADAAALVIAVGIDPLGVSQNLVQTDRRAEPERPSAPPLERQPEPQPEPGDERPSELVIHERPLADEPKINARVALALLGGGGFGPLAQAGAATGLELGAFGPWWRASVRGLWLVPRFTDGGAARLDGFGVAARGCGVPWIGRVELPICAGVEAGLVRGRGTGSTPQPREASLPWAAALLGPGLRWAVHERVALGLDLELLVPISRGGFTVDDAVVSRFAVLGVRGLAGVELRLP